MRHRRRHAHAPRHARTESLPSDFAGQAARTDWRSPSRCKGSPCLPFTFFTGFRLSCSSAASFPCEHCTWHKWWRGCRFHSSRPRSGPRHGPHSHPIRRGAARHHVASSDENMRADQSRLGPYPRDCPRESPTIERPRGFPRGFCGAVTGSAGV
jgi:hypothetical protein